MLYKARNSVIEIFDGYSSKYEATKGTGLKTLTPKQML